MKKLILFLAFFIFFIGFGSAINWADNLDRYYSFNHTSGTTVTDYGGYGNDGTTEAGPVWTGGRLNNSLHFDSSSQKVTIENFTFIDGAYSISMWVNLTNYAEIGLIGSGDSDTYVYFPNSTGLLIQSDLGGDAILFKLPTVALNGWNLITLVRESGTMRAYLNDTESVDGAQSFSNPMTITLIGSYANSGDFFGGRIDEVSMWNRSLSASDISDLWNNGEGEILGSGITHTFNSPTPDDNEQVLIGLTTINVTVDGTGNELTNFSLWINGTLNQTITTTDIINTSLFIKNFSVGAWSYYINSCNNESICVNSSTRTLDAKNWVEHQKYSPATALVGNVENFGMQINLSSGISVTEATFMYDGVGYSVTITGLGSDNYNLTRNFNIPSTTGTLHNYFNGTLSNGIKFNGSTTSMTVSSLAVDDCSVYTFELYNFTVYDEQNPASNIDFTNRTINGTLNMLIYDNDKDVSVVNYSQTYTNSTSFRVCLQNNLTASSNYTIDLDLQYFADGYAKEFYTIYGDDLTSDDIGTQIGLYDLKNSSTTEFELTYRDSSYLPVQNAVIQVQRYYIGEGLKRTVEQPKTDANGQTVLHLEVEDVVYTFIVLVNGQVDAVFNDIKAVCQNPTFNDCTLDLTNVESYIETEDFSKIFDFVFTGPTFDKDTRELETTFSILSGTSAYVTLNVTLFDGLGVTEVCSTGVSSSSGTLSCIVPTSFGNSTIVATLYKDTEKMASNVINLAQNPSDLYGNNLVWVALVIFIGLLGIGMSSNPMITGVFLILNSILLVALNLIYSTGWLGASATILWFIIAVIIIMIKGASRS